MGGSTAKNISGETFGILTAVSRISTKTSANGKKCAIWLFTCECGGATSKTIDEARRSGRGNASGCDSCAASQRAKISSGHLPVRIASQLIGYRYGSLTVLSKREGARKWICQCDCGKICYRHNVGEIQKGSRCLRCAQASRLRDLVGEVFGRLTVIAFVRIKGGTRVWRCSCTCGGVLEEISTSHLKLLPNAGCKECESERRAEIHITHGGALGGKSNLYRTWSAMKARCVDLENPYYGGKGIRVCEEWQDFRQFRRWAKACGYEPHLTIERRDSMRNYEPSNCEWITREENSRRSITAWWREKKAA